jgi:hypothetical protein
MGHDDFFENHGKTIYRGNYYNQNHNHSDDHYNERSYGNFPEKQHFALYLFNRIWSNRKLRLLFVFAALILLIIGILILIAIIPLIVKIYDSIMQNGLKGIVGTITGFIDKIWSGSPK